MASHANEWSARVRSWGELLGLAGILGGFVSLLVLAGWLPLLVQAALWTIFLGSLVLLELLGVVKLFGPVLFYDLIRIARRNRYFLIRILYASALLVMLCWVYFIWTLDFPGSGSQLSPSQAAAFANSFFYMFMGVQFAVVSVITPAYTAGAIAEEKHRRTLEYLLATDLRNREIILSKLVSRLLNLSLLIVTGLPILASLQFLGGVDPLLVLAGFSATALTVASLAGLSIYNSTMARRPRDAIVLTYLMGLTYLGVSGLSWLLTLPTGWGIFPSQFWPGTPATLQDLVVWFNAGNIITALTQLGTHIESGGTLSTILPGLLTRYAIFHALVAVGGPVLALSRLRAVTVKEASEAPAKGRRGIGSRPRVGSEPMLWKEIHAEPSPMNRLHWLGKGVVALLVLMSFAPTLLLMIFFLIDDLDAITGGWRNDLGEQIAEHMNIFQVRMAGTVVACLLLLAVAVRASNSISGERDRQTFDGLLTTPMSSNEMLFGKWAGAILSVRKGWIWLGLIWALGLFTGGLHPFSLVALVITWFVYAAFLSGLGLWFSINCSTSLRATTWTLLTAVMAALGHWLIWMCCLPLLFVGSGPGYAGDGMEVLAKFQAGLTPPVTLAGLLPWSTHSLNESLLSGDEELEMIAYAGAGTVVWVFLAIAMWIVTSVRFSEVTGRLPMQPERAWPTPGHRRVSPEQAEERGGRERELPRHPTSPSDRSRDDDSFEDYQITLPR